jgi:hypothetical protein
VARDEEENGFARPDAQECKAKGRELFSAEAPHGVLHRNLRWTLALFNLVLFILIALAYSDLQTSADPGAAIGMMMALLLLLVGNLLILGLILGLRAFQAHKRRKTM